MKCRSAAEGSFLPASRPPFRTGHWTIAVECLLGTLLKSRDIFPALRDDSVVYESVICRIDLSSFQCKEEVVHGFGGIGGPGVRPEPVSARRRIPSLAGERPLQPARSLSLPCCAREIADEARKTNTAKRSAGSVGEFNSLRKSAGRPRSTAYDRVRAFPGWRAED